MEPGKNPLTSLEVASPCRASWEAMSGDDRVRFCDQCAKNVYNLSDMSRREAEALVRESEGRLCVRFYRRRDGTMLTDNCPVGLRAARRWARIHLAGVWALLGGLVAFLGRPMAGYTGMTMGKLAPRSPEALNSYRAQEYSQEFVPIRLEQPEALKQTSAVTSRGTVQHTRRGMHPKRGSESLVSILGTPSVTSSVGKIPAVPVPDTQPGPQLPNVFSPPAPNGLRLVPDPYFQSPDEPSH
jgi:hypothetical protein